MTNAFFYYEKIDIFKELLKSQDLDFELIGISNIYNIRAFDTKT